MYGRLRVPALVLGTVVSIFASGARATVPGQISYQGFLTNAAGVPYTDPVTLRFRLFDAATGGAPLWTEDHAVSPDQGLIFVALGSVAPLPVFNGETLWLELSVNDTTLVPRRPISSVPYAFRAAVADSAERSALCGTIEGAEIADGAITNADVSGSAAIAGTKVAPDFGAQEVRTTGDLRAGTAHLTGFELPSGAQSGWVLTSDGAGQGTWQPSAATVGGSGTPGAVARFVSATTLGNSAMFESSGNIGVGTTSPTSRLHLLGAAPGSPTALIQGAPGQSAGLLELRDGSGTLVASVSAAGGLSGGGAGLTGLNASNISSGVLPSSRLQGTYASQVTFTNASNSFTGSGGGLVNLNASSLASGFLPSLRLQGTYSSQVTFSNANNSFTGNGGGLANLNASNILAGNLSAARLPTGGIWSLSSPATISSGAGIALYCDVSTSRVGTGTTSPQAKLHVVPPNPSTKGLIVQGSSIGQTSNLQEWQNPSGGVLGFVNASGVLSINGSGITNVDAGSLIGTLSTSRLPAGGSWSLSSPISLDAGTLYVDPGTNRVGIGTSSPSKALTILSDPADYEISTAGTWGLDITTQGADGGAISISSREASSFGIIVDTDNNVGIGVISPVDKLQVNGTFSATGMKNALVPTSRGMTRLYSEESSEVWFSDYGTGRLDSGRARIDLDPLFLETVTVSPREPLKVFVQVRGECHGVYVQSDERGFAVIELQSGRSDVEFDYRAVAKRRGFEDDRLGTAPTP